MECVCSLEDSLQESDSLLPPSRSRETLVLRLDGKPGCPWSHRSSPCVRRRPHCWAPLVRGSRQTLMLHREWCSWRTNQSSELEGTGGGLLFISLVPALPQHVCSPCRPERHSLVVSSFAGVVRWGHRSSEEHEQLRLFCSEAPRGVLKHPAYSLVPMLPLGRFLLEVSLCSNFYFQKEKN